MTKHLLIQEQINKLGGGATSAGGYGGAAGGGYTGGAGGIPTGFGTGAPGAVTSAGGSAGGDGIAGAVTGAVGSYLSGFLGISAAIATAKRATDLHDEYAAYNQNTMRQQSGIVKSNVSMSQYGDMVSGKAAGSNMWNQARNDSKSAAEEAYKGERESKGFWWGSREVGDEEDKKGGYIRSFLGLDDERKAELESEAKGGTQKEGRDRYRSSRIDANAASNLEAQKAKNPELSRASDYFDSNKNRMLQTQQMSGMGDKEMFDMLKGGGLYTEDQKYSMMQGIASAGGSSAQMRSGKEGLDLQRNYGVQNSAGVMGMLSSGLGGGQTAGDSTTKRILADAFGMGLDSSKFSRETEKFLMQSAQFISNSGARTLAEQQNVAALGNIGLTGTSMKDVEAAGTGRAAGMEAMGGGASPMSQAMQVSSMRFGATASLTDPDRNYLVGLNPSEFRESDPVIKSMMARSGKSFDEIKDSFMKAKSTGSSMTTKEKADQDTLGDLAKKYKYSEGGSMNNDTIWKKRTDEANTKEEKDDIEKDRLTQSKLIGESATRSSGRGMFPGLKGEALTEAQQQYTNLANYKKIGDTEIPMMRPSPTQEQGIATIAQKADAASEQALARSSIDNYSSAYEQSAKVMISAADAYISSINKMTIANNGQAVATRQDRAAAISNEKLFNDITTVAPQNPFNLIVR
jgi:hypothetical protein